MYQSISSDSRRSISSYVVPNRPLEAYGKSVVVTEEEFERSLNPNFKAKAKIEKTA
jgi:hypothetical protein